MAQVHSVNTHPELIVRKGLFAKGFRYRLHDSSLPGKPDLVFPKYKAAIQVNGCFWHGHKCTRGNRIPATNKDYWIKKISRNIAGDKRNRVKLKKMGWRLLTVWECELTKGSLRRTLSRIGDWLVHSNS